MSACSGEEIVYPLSALISEPGHGQADGTYVSARSGPPQCASTFGAGFVWSVLGSPIRECRRHCVHIVWGWDWNVPFSTCKAWWEVVTHAGTSQLGANMSRSSMRNSRVMEMVQLAKTRIYRC